jgi:hypothetical protein
MPSWSGTSCGFTQRAPRVIDFSATAPWLLAGSRARRRDRAGGYFFFPTGAILLACCCEPIAVAVSEKVRRRIVTEVVGGAIVLP